MRLSKAVAIPLLAGLIVQIATAWDGFFFHSDEYFQIIEFAAHKYHFGVTGKLTWEFTEQIRPSIQIHFFNWWHNVLSVIGINDPFLVLNLLYVLIGIVFFAISNYLIIDRFKDKTYLPKLLWLNNFFWVMPYLRCKYSAEMMGALICITGIILLYKLIEKKSSPLNALSLLITGLIFSISFYCRFQMLFAFAGLLIWFALVHWQQWKKGLVVLTGFIIGVGFNTWLDKLFYGDWVCTPYRYFYANLIEGKAASFGTSPWWYYLVILLAIGIPLAGFALFSFFAKAMTLYKNPFVLSTLFFVIGHSMVGHKEERFIFPVVVLMVYLAAEAYSNFPKMVAWAKRLWRNEYIGWLVRGGIYFSIGMNLLLVLLLSFETYKQPVLFIKRFNEDIKATDHIIAFKQNPYETESGLRYRFLSQDKFDRNIDVINNRDSFLAVLRQHPQYKYCILIKDAKENNLNYLLQKRDGIVASSFVWNIGNWLAVNHNIIIPDLWICQQYGEVK